MKRLWRAIVGTGTLVLVPAIARAADPRDEALLAACGPGDEALGRVATDLATRRAAGAPLPEADEIARRFRFEGGTAPNVRAVAFLHAESKRDALVERVRAFSENLPTHRMCGVGSAKNAAGEEVIVALAAPVLGSMDAIPRSTRAGAWVTVRAQVPDATGARLVVLGPRGAPRSIPKSFANGLLVGRFSADHAGEWLVQVVADRDDGPRPVLEASTFVGALPPRDDVASAPGDDAIGSDDEHAIRAMIDAARASGGRRPLATDDGLAKLAAAHARSMAKRGVLAHDDEGEDPAERAAKSGIVATEIGENVAHAQGAQGAHRALWASPSHRENLLSARFKRVGVGTARGADGSLWVAEAFAD